jgi:hypothetical protein
MKRWTNKEIRILRDNYKTQSRENLCNILSSRTWSAIKLKAITLELTNKKNRTIRERFWSFVDRKPHNKCWDWTGAFAGGSYGVIKINKKNILAHRFCYKLCFGEIPNCLFVCHSCDNPKCVNPSHLFLGRHKDNMNDMVKKDRQAVGENNGRCKITLVQVEKIRALKGKLSQEKIAKLFNISKTTVGHIHRNETWKYFK